jgi:formylglycine-generating enzyme required for sulfatase activity
MKTFRLWQDKEAIPYGKHWKAEIESAVAQSVFFIPIITPTAVASPDCKFELDLFIAREATLGRTDLVFPIYYIEIDALEDSVAQQNDPVLSFIAKRQYRDWREFRHRDINETDAKKAVEDFCRDIRKALRRSWLSPEEQKKPEEAEAHQRAEEEQQHEVEARRREEEARRKAEAEAQERQRAVEERRRQEEEAKRLAEEERWRNTAAEAERQRLERDAAAGREAERRKEEEDERRQTDEEHRRLKPGPAWPPSRRALVSAGVFFVIVVGSVGVWFADTRRTPVLLKTPPVQSVVPLSPDREGALKPKDTFKECENCPEMVVVPAGRFMMGSPGTEAGRDNDEGPQHPVSFMKPFAVGKFAVTFDEWDACVADGGCNGYRPSDQGWGRGRRPVINVSWDDATVYAAWLSRKTRKTYRLLSEAEREYVTRAATTTPFWWGASISTQQANYNGNETYGNGPKGEYRQRTLPVDSFEPNPWGLYQVHGNVWEWTQDCYHDSYAGAPSNGSAWTTGDCILRVVRSDSWRGLPRSLRSANRIGLTTDNRVFDLGFRLARTLTP